jgi:hypothetical protein
MAEFPDLLINPNPDAPTLDASGNQVRGINIFETTAERDVLNATVRIPGALAIIKGSDELYQYTADTVDDTAWQDDANWLGVGSAGGSGVQNVNNLNGNVTLIAGDGIEIDVITGNNEIEITSTGGGGGSTDGEDISFIVRDAPYTSDYDHEGTVFNFGLTGTLPFRVYRWSGAAWTAADNTGVSNATGLLALGLNSDAFVLEKGIVSLTFAPPFTAGDVLYLGTGVPAITNDISTLTSGEIVRVVGVYLGQSGSVYKTYFNPSPDWIEIA